MRIFELDLTLNISGTSFRPQAFFKFLLGIHSKWVDGYSYNYTSPIQSQLHVVVAEAMILSYIQV